MSSISLVALYGGILILMQVAISIRVTVARGKAGISFGWGNDMEFAKIVRAHGNFAEYVPITLIVMALMAMGGAAPWALHMIGGGLVVGRASHALGIYTDKTIGRVIGQTLTWIVMAAAGILILMPGLAS